MYQPTHGHSQSLSSPPMGSSEHGSPTSPGRNPFEGGEPLIAGGRTKYGRTMTSQPTPKPLPTIRRSLSHDSSSSPNPKGLAAGLQSIKLVPVTQKVGSRHADVIDEWDGSGVGRSMWHHSGPYDAAAPSRNLHLPRTKAPMQAFHGQPPPLGTNPAAGSSNISNTSTDTFSTSAPTALPYSGTGNSPTFVDPPAGHSGKSKSGGKLSQRAQHALKQGGGALSPTGISSLSAQYSTSMPNSGGYFPTSGNGSGGGAGDGELDERRQRERDREVKRKAMQAAWGIDNPEPFEEFGYTQQYDDPVDLQDEPTPLPSTSFTGRSPGPPMSNPLSAELNGPSSPSGEYFSDRRGSGNDGGHSPGLTRSTSGAVGGAVGLGRKKSLMQKIKSMRDNPNLPLAGGGVGRSGSPNGGPNPAPWTEQPSRGSTPTEEYPKGPRRNSFLGIRKGSKSNDAFTPPLPGDEQEMLNERVVNAGPAAGGEYVVLSSPSKAQPERRGSAGVGGYAAKGISNSRTRSGSRGGKDLPAPPVQPVMPDFGEGGGGGGRIRFDQNERGNGDLGGSGMQRKTSLVKKLKDRMTR